MAHSYRSPFGPTRSTGFFRREWVGNTAIGVERLPPFHVWQMLGQFSDSAVCHKYLPRHWAHHWETPSLGSRSYFSCTHARVIGLNLNLMPTPHRTPDMNQDLQPKADELIRALGALGLAQERIPDSQVVAALTHRAEQLHESLSPSNSAS